MRNRFAATLVVIFWLFVAAALGLFGYWLGIDTIIPGPASEDAILSNPGEVEAISAGLAPKDSLLIILSLKEGLGSEQELERAKEDLIQELKNIKDPKGQKKLFEKFEASGHTLFDDTIFESKDKKNLLIVAHTSSPIDKADDQLKELPNYFKELKAKLTSVNLYYISNGTADLEMFDLINKDLDRSLVYTLPLTFFVLLIAFRSFVAALVPLIIALVSLCASLGFAALYSHTIKPISATSSQLVVLLVLAIGIDYSLFIISRMREEVRKGSSYPDAIRKARSSTGVAVFWSGLTVALSLFGLLLMDDTILTSMAVVSISAVILTVLGSLIFLPALLLLLQDKIEKGRVPFAKSSNKPSFFTQWLSISVKKPLSMLSTSFVLIAGLAVFSFYLRLGTTVEPQVMPKQLESKKAYEVLSENFPDLAGSDFSLILTSKKSANIDENEDAQSVLDLIASHETVRGPFRVEYSEDNTVARYRYTAVGSANDAENQNLIERIKEELHLHNHGKSEISGYISGTLPYVVENIEQYSKRTPLVLGAVLVLCFLFLLVAFRSIVVPLKAIVLNVFSTVAAFGVLTIVFQFSGDASWNYGVVESFIPPLLFAILFGLSMDYHVFLLSRIREEVLKGYEIQEAVRSGIVLTSGAITSAALIMVAVFAIIASLELPIMKELGVGLAVAILIDATLIRSVMLPASMVLLGKLNWYFPSWLKRLPEIKME